MTRRRLISISAVVALVVLGLVLHRPLIEWFTGTSRSGGGRSATVSTTAGPFTVEAAIAPDPPREKGNVVHLRIAADGKPVTGATLGIEYVMPAMGAMAEMRGRADIREDGDGRYRASFDLPMRGSWTLELAITAAARNGSARFSFTIDRRGLAAARGAGATAESPQPPVLATIALPPPALTAVERGLDAYERSRAVLAADKIDGIATYARDLAEALRAASAGLTDATVDITACFDQGAKAADELAAATTLDDARARFGEVSRFVIAVVTADPRLQAGWHRFDCSMANGFGGWLQRSPDIANPYMGTAMTTCGTRESFEPIAASGGALSHEGHGHEGSDISYYTCPMHPSVRQHDPGQCPICGMDLAGVTYEQQESGTIFVDESRRSVLGIKTSKVEQKPMTLAIRAVGRVTYDETRLQDITLKVKGWVTRLDVNATGQAVARGQRLLSLYSPELFAAQQEYLLALRQSEGSGAPEHATSLAAASAKKLRLLGLTDGQLAEIRRRGTPIEEIPVVSPASGFVIAKDIVDGAAVEPGQRLYRIAALDQIWIEAAVYESDLPHVKKDQVARVTLPSTDDREVTGKVATVYPYLDAASRTGKVRIQLPNKDLALKPDMYADVAIDVDLGSRLTVPVSAVVYTGTRRIVFLDLGGGQFRPQEVKLGARAGHLVEVTTGLTAAQSVVTEGNFLIAAESRIRSTTFWEDEHGAK